MTFIVTIDDGDWVTGEDIYLGIVRELLEHCRDYGLRRPSITIREEQTP